MATTSIAVAETASVLFLLRRADDALILGHRLSEWCGHAPMPEEDMALANIGLDLIGQARTLYDAAGVAEGAGHDEDHYAYLRDAPQFRNLLLTEQPNGDFARTIVRQFFYSAFADPYWRAMQASTDPTIAAIAAKSEKESAYHLRHASEWVVRLGDGTDESHRRAQDAVDALWPFTGEMFEVDAAERDIIAGGVATDPAALRDVWEATLRTVLARAGLALPAGAWMQTGGTQRPPHRTSRPSADRDAVSRPHLSGCRLVSDAGLRDSAWAAAASVVDPELPALTIAELGVLRDVTVADGGIEVTITPTYSGCPAMQVIALDIVVALERAGFPGARVRTVLSPAWTTAWLSVEARGKLLADGIAPPAEGEGRAALFGATSPACPRCGSTATERLAEFGSTACKALWRCTACREPVRPLQVPLTKWPPRSRVSTC